MKEIFVRDLKGKLGLSGDSYFMITSVEIRRGSTGKEYLDLVLTDSTGDVPGKKWSVDLPDRNLKVGDLVKARFEVTDFNGQTQIKVEKIRITNEEDNLDITDYVKHAPEDTIDMYEEILGYAKSIKDDELKSVALKVLEDNKEKLLYYPAAKKNHHAMYGGLLYHMVRMLRLGIKMCEVYTNLRCDLVVCGVIIHDIEKVNEIVSDENGVSSDYSLEGNLLGHIIMGVKTIDRICLELGINDEKRLMLDHMILSHHYEPDFGSPKKPLFPEAEALHYLDMIDAKMFDIEDAYDKASEGEFSDKIWTLDNRKIYHDTL